MTEPTNGCADLLRQSIYRQFLWVMFLLSVLLLGGSAPAQAQIAPRISFNVNTTADTWDANPGDGLCADSTPKCSLRAAIMEANALGGATINLPGAQLYRTTILAGLTDELFGDLDISGNVTIKGVGGTPVIDGNSTNGVIEVGPGAALSLSDVSLQHGIATIGGGLYVGLYSIAELHRVTVTLNRASTGGGIALTDSASIEIEESIIASNAAQGNGGGIAGANDTLIVIRDSAIHNNEILGSALYSGAGIYTGTGSLDISNSTVSANGHSSPATPVNGAGIYIASAADETALLSFVTIAGNTANAGIGGGVFSLGASMPIVTNSIIADNIAPDNMNPDRPDCAGTFEIVGTVLIEAPLAGTPCAFTGTGAVQTGDPGLFGLGNNGGLSSTHAFASNSPAVNRVPAANCPPADQRGVARPQGATCDLGAFELEAGQDGFLLPLVEFVVPDVEDLDSLTVMVSDNDLVGDATLDVTVEVDNGEENGDVETLTLMSPSLNGFFTGKITVDALPGFDAPPDPQSGALEAWYGDDIDVTYLDMGTAGVFPVKRTGSTDVRALGVAGTIAASKPNVVAGDGITITAASEVTVTYTDADYDVPYVWFEITDLNTGAFVDEVQVDGSGGVYSATFSVVSGAALAVDGTEITVPAGHILKFSSTDYPDGSGQLVSRFTLVNVVAFGTNGIIYGSTYASPGGQVEVSVYDPDLDAPSLTVTAASTGGDRETLTLARIVAGGYTLVIDESGSIVEPGDGILQGQYPDVFTFTYEDSLTSGGGVATARHRIAVTTEIAKNGDFEDDGVCTFAQWKRSSSSDKARRDVETDCAFVFKGGGASATLKQFASVPPGGFPDELGVVFSVRVFAVPATKLTAKVIVKYAGGSSKTRSAALTDNPSGDYRTAFITFTTDDGADHEDIVKVQIVFTDKSKRGKASIKAVSLQAYSLDTAPPGRQPAPLPPPAAPNGFRSAGS